MFCPHPIFSRDEILVTTLLERMRNLGQPYPTSFGVVVGSMTAIFFFEIFSLLISTIPIYFPSFSSSPTNGIYATPTLSYFIISRLWCYKQIKAASKPFITLTFDAENGQVQEYDPTACGS